MQKTIQIADEIINYSIENELDTQKPFVLFIHGFGDSLGTVKPIEKIENRNYNIVAIDMPGCGQSTWNRKPLSLEYYFEVIKEFAIKVLNGKKFYVMGHSLGCLSTLYVLKHTDARYGLLVAPAHYVITQKRVEFGMRHLIPQSEFYAKQSYMSLSYKHQAQMEKSAPLYVTKVLDKDWTRFKKFHKIVYDQMLNPTYVFNNYYPLYSDVDNYMIASGDQDLFTHIEEIRVVATQQQKELHVLKDTGHAAFLDSADEIHAIIEKMIKEH